MQELCDVLGFMVATGCRSRTKAEAWLRSHGSLDRAVTTWVQRSDFSAVLDALGGKNEVKHGIRRDVAARDAALTIRLFGDGFTVVHDGTTLKPKRAKVATLKDVGRDELWQYKTNMDVLHSLRDGRMPLGLKASSVCVDDYLPWDYAAYLDDQRRQGTSRHTLVALRKKRLARFDDHRTKETKKQCC